jgi:hypothetical protein
MSKLLDSIDDDLARWIGRQHLFFVATAPLSPDGHINCSPKGRDSLRVLGPQEIVYLDYTGSGAETIAHLRENGRIIVMFCAFEGKPNIVRLHGRGEALPPEHPEFAPLSALFPPNPGSRSIIRVRIDRVSTSCGYAVPTYDFRQERDLLDKWAVTKGEKGLETYRASKNAASIDGLPALASPPDSQLRLPAEPDQ